VVPLVDRGDSVLVVVDAQPGFVADSPRGEAAVLAIAWLCGMAARIGVPVVAVEEGPEREGRTDARVLARLPEGTPVIEKPTFGLCGCDAAVDALRATGRTTAVVTGFETDVCVAQSAIGLLDLGFRAVVPEDATYTTSDREHARGMTRMTAAGVEPSHCKGLIFEWLRDVGYAIEVFDGAKELGTTPWRLDAAPPAER
jgi:nicotinamidase-related amidase